MRVLENFKVTPCLVGRNVYAFVYDVSKMNGSLWIESENRKVNGKSILGILSLNLKLDDSVNIYVDGNNSDIKKYINYLNREDV